MKYFRFTLMWLGLVGVVRAEVPAELLDRVPAGANALVIVDAAQLFGNPLAQRESWTAAYTDVYGSTPLLMPPDTTSMVLAAELDFQFLKPQWEVAVLEVTEPRTAESIAAKTQGEVDRIADVPAVETPFGAYVVQLAPQRYAVFAPSNRQAVARWIRQGGESPAPSMSPYLRRMAQRVRQARASMGLAIDLEQIVSVPAARAELAMSEALRAHNISADRAASHGRRAGRHPAGDRFRSAAGFVDDRFQRRRLVSGTGGRPVRDGATPAARRFDGPVEGLAGRREWPGTDDDRPTGHQRSDRRAECLPVVPVPAGESGRRRAVHTA